MKYFVFFVLCCVALAAAAPQLIYPGLLGPVVGPRTVVAGPTVVNGWNGLGVGGLIAPGVVGVL